MLARFGGAAIRKALGPPNGAVFENRRMASTLFVGGLAWSLNDEVLRDAFSSFGQVAEAKVMVDRETGRSRGFGFVRFVSEEDAQSAVEAMDGKELSGREIRVNYAAKDNPGRMSPGFTSGGTGGFGR